MKQGSRLLLFTLGLVGVGVLVIGVLTLLGPRIGGVYSCTTIYSMIGASVVDSQTGEAISGAYWRSQVLSERPRDQTVIQELNEGWTEANYPPYLVADDYLGGSRLRRAGEASTLQVRVIIDKEGYQRMERVFDVNWDGCHVSAPEADLEFRLVREEGN